MKKDYIKSIVSFLIKERKVDVRVRVEAAKKRQAAKEWRESKLNSKEFGMMKGFTEGTVRRWAKSCRV